MATSPENRESVTYVSGTFCHLCLGSLILSLAPKAKNARLKPWCSTVPTRLLGEGYLTGPDVHEQRHRAVRNHEDNDASAARGVGRRAHQH